jgi:hypothetical protein
VTRTALILAALLGSAACAKALTFEELAASCAAAGYIAGTDGHFACLFHTMQPVFCPKYLWAQ